MPDGPGVFRVLRSAVGRNAAEKLLAAALAVALWSYVAGETKVQVGFDVPLEIRNIPAGMVVLNKVERQVGVDLSGPPSLLSNLPRSEIVAAIDLSAAGPGRHDVALFPRSVRVPPGIEVRRIYPGAVEVELDRLERRRIPVKVRVGGPAKVRRRIDRILVSPETVEVEVLTRDADGLKHIETEEVVPDRTDGVFTAVARVDLRVDRAKIVGDPGVRVTIHFRK
jgi:YbbR domain-containing protein